jgi:general secretion pathway protein F
MAVFTYIALDSATDDVTGTIAADTPRQARELLRERGLLVRDISDYRERSSGRTPLRSRIKKSSARRSARHQATTFIRELSTLLGVGLPLLESLETIGRQHHGLFQTGILLLRDRVAAGSSLASAMGEQHTGKIPVAHRQFMATAHPRKPASR